MAWLGRSFRFLWRLLDGLRKVLHLVVLLFLVSILLFLARQPLPLVPSRAALVIQPHGHLVEQLTGSPWDRGVSALTQDREPETLVRDLTEAIRAAAKDERIKVLVLDTEELGSAGLTKLKAVAAAIQTFRATGKKVLAFAHYATQ